MLNLVVGLQDLTVGFFNRRSLHLSVSPYSNAPCRTRTFNLRFRRKLTKRHFPANTGLFVSRFYVLCHPFQGFGTDLARNLSHERRQRRSLRTALSTLI